MKPDLKVVVSNPPAPAPAASAAAPVAAAAEARLDESAGDLTAAAADEGLPAAFALVRGEPFTALPRDLYIPPQALEVFLEAFEGPLDLLLYLIRRQNLDILDIPLADITRQYMDYIELMNGLELELAGEYLVMAATLAEIKSRMLLPRSGAALSEEDDPRADLVRRLQEYERYKRAAENIEALPRLERDVWSASAEFAERRAARALPQLTLQEMLFAFKDVVVRAELFSHHRVQRERLSVRARMSDILATLERTGFVEFARLFRVEEGRMGVTVTFVAILELIREGLIDVVQSEPCAPLHVRRADAHGRLRLVAGSTEGSDALAGAADASAGAAAEESFATDDPTLHPGDYGDEGDSAEDAAALEDDWELPPAGRLRDPGAEGGGGRNGNGGGK
jgi:segregation and condensation protein A